ncbi:MAG: asparagine synthase (glutamine-hydrolyzing) [Candidatus Acididesulfobacter diazotrophicus]|jgi:asparagine synthase (glutamine-hydrolysing)|uniref:asparagine synthase (glutamine-hydrolyzing) n=1 Tax=Candidatus Acididesulfobacter diazotrophicus TaxID=2597226 RepID=A0A519BJW6_9DELT|nr:MAG: asparagine synthase (glutamine-hydrolyzing) [Candidatus Acididesulfobacter diazotrophicus]
MCGICGVYGEKKTADVSKMLGAISHRGPDGKKIEVSPWGSLGFCRLDIFGSSGANQPAISIDRQVAVVFNGEIYNFEELKASLSFKEDITDEAELILALFLKYGEKCFSKLKGMFAIAIMTSLKLILARDAVGIKPLVYFSYKNRLYFASEIKALLQVKEDVIEIDEDALGEAAVFGFVFSFEKTMFKGIGQVRPGTYLVFESGKIECKTFYKLPSSFYEYSSSNETGITSKFSSIMDSSAKRFLMHSKHPQSIYLSGGLDSSLMTWFLQKNSHAPLDTFNLFDDDKSEDRSFASKVADELRTNHEEIKTNIEECLQWIDHYLYYYESLVTDGIFNVIGSLAFHILSSYIGKTHKLAYCGEGADELFGGYYWMHSHPLGFSDRLRSRAYQVNNGNTRINDYIQKKFPANDSQEDNIRREIFDILMGPGLTNCHLWSVDRSSSAFSFEARPLYLYDDVREWALSLPIEKKISGKNTKILLKKYAQKLGSPLFAEIATRKKIGMPAAMNVSLKNLSAYALKEFSNKKGDDNPHKQYASFFNTDLERLMFDRFYQIFIVNRGKVPHNVTSVDKM